jgi:WD40 repeat protein
VLGPFDGGIIDLALHPQGESVAAAFADRIQLFNLRQPGSPPVSLPLTEKSVVSHLVYHPSKNSLIAVLRDRETTLSDDPTATVSTWDLDHAREAPVRLLTTIGQVRDLMIHPNGRDMLVTSMERDGYSRSARSISLVDLSQAEATRVILRGHEGHITKVAFHPDGLRLVSSATDGTIRGWDLRQPQSRPRVLGWHAKGVLTSAADELGQQYPAFKSINALALESAGRWIATLDVKGVLRLWDLERADASPVVAHAMGSLQRYSNVALAFSRNGKRLIIAIDQDVWRWDILTQRSRNQKG